MSKSERQIFSRLLSLACTFFGVLPAIVWADVVTASVGLDLKVFIETTEEQPVNGSDYLGAWRKACLQIRNLLENRSGKLGEGPFQKVQCVEQPSRLENILAEEKVSWIFKVHDTDEQSGFEIFYTEGDKKNRLEARLVAGPSDKFMESLSDQSFLESAILVLLDQLPMFSRVDPGKLAEKVEISSGRLWSEMPGAIMLYTLHFDETSDQWRARPIGSMIQESNSVWMVRLRNMLGASREPLFAHNAEGRSKATAAARVRVEDHFSKFDIGFSDLLKGLAKISKNYSGIRYGHPALESQNVLAKAPMVSAFTELRSGYLNGLRFYYDLVPKRTFSDNSANKEHFEWSRICAGWSFQLPVNRWNFLLDVQPKVGLLSLSGELATYDEAGFRFPLLFDMKNALSFGMELGGERVFRQVYQLRGWTSFKRSIDVGKYSSTSYTSLRTGLDIYRDLGFFSGLNLKGLLFGAMDRTILGKTDKGQEVKNENNDAIQVNEISYQLVYLGMGMIVAW